MLWNKLVSQSHTTITTMGGKRKWQRRRRHVGLFVFGVSLQTQQEGGEEGKRGGQQWRDGVSVVCLFLEEKERIIKKQKEGGIYRKSKGFIIINIRTTGTISSPHKDSFVVVL